MFVSDGRSTMMLASSSTTIGAGASSICISLRETSSTAEGTLYKVSLSIATTTDVSTSVFESFISLSGGPSRSYSTVSTMFVSDGGRSMTTLASSSNTIGACVSSILVSWTGISSTVEGMVVVVSLSMATTTVASTSTFESFISLSGGGLSRSYSCNGTRYSTAFVSDAVRSTITSASSTIGAGASSICISSTETSNTAEAMVVVVSLSMTTTSVVSASTFESFISVSGGPSRS